jgi:Uma2 family endonuclease
MSQSSWQPDEHDQDEIPVPDVSGLVTEDDTPVDGVYSEKQIRLLTEPLFSSWSPPHDRKFFLAANVGVFSTAANQPLVPDVFLSLDTAPRQPFDDKRNRSYFVWEHGKPPDVVIEVVSNTEGDELTRKLRGYERMRVTHYVVFDPSHHLGDSTLTRFELHAGALVETQGALILPELDLGLTLWQGVFEREQATWLRWCRANGELIPTGAEQRQRADAERQRADRLAAKLRELGVDPDDV